MNVSNSKLFEFSAIRGISANLDSRINTELIAQRLQLNNERGITDPWKRLPGQDLRNDSFIIKFDPDLDSRHVLTNSGG